MQRVVLDGVRGASALRSSRLATPARRSRHAWERAGWAQMLVAERRRAAHDVVGAHR